MGVEGYGTGDIGQVESVAWQLTTIGRRQSANRGQGADIHLMDAPVPCEAPLKIPAAFGLVTCVYTLLRLSFSFRL
jgi:hypothetical protein